MKNKRLAGHVILPPAFDNEKVHIPMAPLPVIENPSEEELDAIMQLREDIARIEKENQEADLREWEEENAPTLIKDLRNSLKPDTLLKVCNYFYSLCKKHQV